MLDEEGSAHCMHLWDEKHFACWISKCFVCYWRPYPPLWTYLCQLHSIPLICSVFWPKPLTRHEMGQPLLFPSPPCREVLFHSSFHFLSLSTEITTYYAVEHKIILPLGFIACDFQEVLKMGSRIQITRALVGPCVFLDPAFGKHIEKWRTKCLCNITSVQLNLVSTPRDTDRMVENFCLEVCQV